MTPEELKAMLESANASIVEQKEINEAAAVKIKELEVKAESAIGAEEAEEIKNLISDLESKVKTPLSAVTAEDEQKALKSVVVKVTADWARGKQNGTAADLYKYVADKGTEKFKALNITNADEGGRAIAEILSRDVIEYAREYSPILENVGRKSSMTRNYRELVLVSYPSVQEGIENVAGTSISETTTQEYKEVVSGTFKVNAKPRITDEAMYGTDIDIYGQLTSLLGREISIYLANQVLFGDGSAKSARGILSSNRVDITDTSGESFKPTLASNPDNARPADYYPVKATGVSGAIGADDTAIVDFVIDVANEFPTMYLGGAKWYMNRKTKGIFEKVRDSEGNPIFKMSYREGGGVVLNGYPVIIDDTMPDVAADSTFAIFGNLGLAYAINDGDIDKMLIDPYTVDGCTVIKYDKEMFEMVQNSDAIIVCAATTNSGA